MKALKAEKKADGQTYNRTKSDQDSVRYQQKTEPDFVGSGYYPPERFVPLLAKFSHPASATQRVQVFNQLQRHYGNRYVQRVVSAYRSQNVEEDDNKELASEIISKKGSGRPLEPGNQAVQRLFKSGVIQAKLKIGQPGDIYEQEADRVAEQVMQMPEPLVQRPLYEEERLQTKEIPGQTPEVTPDIESRINSIRGSGQPLPKSARAFFEPRFGYDFSSVCVHSNPEAADMARVLNARAFTTGRDIVFGAGQYTLGTTVGRRLLAHELTHAVQQSDVVPEALLMVTESSEVAEAEAETVGKAAALGQPVGETLFGSRLAVQFAPEEAGKGTKLAVPEKGGKAESKEGGVGGLYAKAYYLVFLKPMMEELWDQLHRKVEEHRRHLLALTCLAEAAQPGADTLDVIRFCETYEALKEVPVVGRIISFLEDTLKVPQAVTLGMKIITFLRPVVERERLKAATLIDFKKCISVAGILKHAKSPKEVMEATKQKALEVSKLISEIEKYADKMKDIEAELGIGKEASGTVGK